MTCHSLTGKMAVRGKDSGVKACRFAGRGGVVLQVRKQPVRYNNIRSDPVV